MALPGALRLNPERWALVGRLFEKAHGLEPEAREALLARECASDPEMRVEVESLLAWHSLADSFLETPAAAPRASVPHRIGPWDLVRELDRGGMGVVYEGVRNDQGYERRAAVKLVKRGMDTDSVLARFERERRILASLDHPNIARVLDGGSTEDGQPYFVMELIEGRSLLDYCAEEKLTTAKRLLLFRRLCSAVAYAHQRLVIHRDIKPANVLVTGEGVPKLLDFGLAKVLARDGQDPAARTETSLRLFTPDYASPEQVRGEELTTATDVYSLGVVLYELLTGQRPYRLRTTDPDEIRRAVMEQDPPRPSTRAKVDSDLDAIVAAALRKEPHRRYASVERLDADVARHLEGHPVLARPDGFRYRAGKFVRRHALELGAAGLVAASLILALAVSVRQMAVARAERDNARREAAKARTVSSFLEGLFASSAPHRSHGEKLSAQDLLDAGATRVETELKDQPEIAASMLALLGSVYQELGLYRKAEPLLARSVEIRERFPNGSSELADSLYALGRLKQRAADIPAARALLERAVRLHEQGGGVSSALAADLSELAVSYLTTGDLPRAHALLARAVAVEEAARGPNLHKWLSNLAAVDIEAGDLESARSLLERALALQDGSKGRDDLSNDVTLLNLAEIYRQDESFEKARALVERALAVDERVYGPEHEAVVFGLGILGDLALRMGDRERARDLLARSIAAGERLFGREHVGLAQPLGATGRLLLAEGRPGEALAVLERALHIRQKTAEAPEGEDIAERLADVALAHERLEGPGAAEPLLARALAMQRKALAPGHRFLVPTLVALARVVRDQGRAGEAQALAAEAVGIARAKLPERHSARLEAEALERSLPPAR